MNFHVYACMNSFRPTVISMHIGDPSMTPAIFIVAPTGCYFECRYAIEETGTEVVRLNYGLYNRPERILMTHWFVFHSIRPSYMTTKRSSMQHLKRGTPAMINWIVFGGWAVPPSVLNPVFGVDAHYIDVIALMPSLLNNATLSDDWEQEIYDIIVAGESFPTHRSVLQAGLPAQCSPGALPPN